jgi:hypothetical protein
VRLLSVLGLFVLLGACREKVTRAECARMLGHYVEMNAAQDPSLAGLTPEQATDVRAEIVAEKRAGADFARAEEQCMREVTRTELECALKTSTPNDWEACVE